MTAPSIAARRPRTADPWLDLRVIDERAPRTNQAFVGILATVGVATGWWPIFALVALQLTLSVTLGRRWCLPCLLLLRGAAAAPGRGPARGQPAAPLRDHVGAVFLRAATAASVLGYGHVGAVLGGVVAGLANLGATTGFCTGCAIYRAVAALRGRPCDAGGVVPPRSEDPTA